LIDEIDMIARIAAIIRDAGTIKVDVSLFLSISIIRKREIKKLIIMSDIIPTNILNICLVKDVISFL
jgi:hypothetical protein